MKHQNLTFSIPEDLKAHLQLHVQKRGLSRFISEAIFKALREEEHAQEKELDAAYEAANLDADRLETLKDWDKIEEVNDLIDDDEDWTWLRSKNG